MDCRPSGWRMGGRSLEDRPRRYAGGRTNFRPVGGNPTFTPRLHSLPCRGPPRYERQIPTRLNSRSLPLEQKRCSEDKLAMGTAGRSLPSKHAASDACLSGRGKPIAAAAYGFRAERGPCNADTGQRRRTTPVLERQHPRGMGFLCQTAVEFRRRLRVKPTLPTRCVFIVIEVHFQALL